nr:MAG TPA: hypothetical protein [Bacteriophage sp.]
MQLYIRHYYVRLLNFVFTFVPPVLIFFVKISKGNESFLFSVHIIMCFTI